jgi:hypothetical protein
MKRTVAVFALALAISAIAFAHGNEKHVMGTVTSISDNSITVETTSKKTVTVTLSTATKFQKSGRALPTPRLWRQAFRNLIARGELWGVAALVIIGVALIVLAPAKSVERVSAAVA